MKNQELALIAEGLQNMMLSIATGGSEKDASYVELRRQLIEEPESERHLPRMVKTCRSAQQFWQHIKGVSDKYEGRRQHIWKEFEPLLSHLERASRGSPSDDTVSTALERFDAEHIHSTWKKALERRMIDAEGAITSARTLLEATCKHILEDRGVDYDEKDDLPKLYRRTAESLNIAPSQHTADVFKQILGGCTAVVEGLGTLRNRLSDAHGKGRTGVKPQPRHAELAVNLAGALSLYLLSTHQAGVGTGVRAK
jgi:hypothetical protein